MARSLLTFRRMKNVQVHFLSEYSVAWVGGLLAGTMLLACTMNSNDVDDAGDGTGGMAAASGAVGGSSDCGVGGNGSTLLCADGSRACTQIVIPDQRCSFSQSEALAGVDIQYQVISAEAVDNVYPEPLDQGGCGTPDDSGLIVFEELASTTGGPEQYCQCDVGLCAPGDPVAVALPAGTFVKTFHWEGRSFSGPSDTGDSPGEPFPPGLYILRLTAAGQQELNGSKQTYGVNAGMTLRITED